MEDDEPSDYYELEDEPKHFEVFGNKHIEGNAIRQMQMAMQLPIAAYGALMPDAHQGYGLPIGGVLAADNAVDSIWRRHGHWLPHGAEYS